ncbi:SSI family serine proteinase inhibitor [Streptomyces sp. NPDC020965]|uniref:SSI family serine proteinase inhibitor n=1 Tax=Streptomyces sp. NPDC020965 TaxID=3365105 RepID=UPI0037897A9A
MHLSHRARRGLVIAVATLFALALAGPAQGARDEPAEGLRLTVSGNENGWTRGVQLLCDPEPAGTHPEAAAACAALTKARGDFDKLPAESRACNKRYDPVTVAATGTWGDRPTEWTRTYGNACELGAATGAVFRF